MHNQLYKVKDRQPKPKHHFDAEEKAAFFSAKTHEDPAHVKRHWTLPLRRRDTSSATGLYPCVVVSLTATAASTATATVGNICIC